MQPHWLVFYCDICKVSLKYFFIYGTLNLTFYITLHYIISPRNLVSYESCQRHFIDMSACKVAIDMHNVQTTGLRMF